MQENCFILPVSIRDLVGAECDCQKACRSGERLVLLPVVIVVKLASQANVLSAVWPSLNSSGLSDKEIEGPG